MERRFICILFLLVSHSCGKHNFPEYKEHSVEARENQYAGNYRATFRPLNSGIGPKIKAHSVLWTKENQFYVRIVMQAGFGSTRHRQFIHTGFRCPDKFDDKNGDEIIDRAEVLKSSGQQLIPLDGSLRSQVHGLEWFPRTNTHGAFYYSISANLINLMKDLKSQDAHPQDDIGKLSVNEKLDLEQRTIIIYGSYTDPMMPVACAEIEDDFI